MGEGERRDKSSSLPYDVDSLDLDLILFHFELLNVFKIRHLQRFLNNKVLCQSCQNVLSKVAFYVFLQHIFFYSIEPSKMRESVNEMSKILVLIGRGGGTMRKTLKYLNIMVIIFQQQKSIINTVIV